MSNQQGKMRLTVGHNSAALYPPRKANGLSPSMVDVMV